MSGTTTPIAAPRRPTARLGYLDVLRGAAALGVAWYHYALALREEGAPLEHHTGTVTWLLTEVFDLGKIGVVLFFAISGFIIPASLARARAAPGVAGEGRWASLRRFLVGRLFRLYPLYWLTLPLCIAVAAPELPVPGLRAVAANLTMVQGFLGVGDINGVAWTLQIEIVFYALCVLLFVAGRLGSPQHQYRSALLWLAAALALAVLRWWFERKLPVALPLALAVMFLGSLWRGARVDRDVASRCLARRLVAAFALVLPPVCALAYSADHGFGETWYRYLLSYATALAVFLYCVARRWPDWGPLAHLGTISYAIYLLHAPIFAAAMRLGLHPGPGTAPLLVHLWTAGVLLVAVVASHCAYRWVEAPAIALGRRVARALARPGSAPVAAPAPGPAA